MSEIKNLNVTYDRGSDVLYITKQKTPAVHGVEDQYGIVWRYNSAGDLIGAIVVDFLDVWLNRRPLLEAEISRHFHIPHSHAMVVVDHAMSEHRS